MLKIAVAHNGQLLSHYSSEESFLPYYTVFSIFSV